MFRRRLPILLLAALFLASTSSAEDTLRKLWRSRRYSPAAVPAEWQSSSPREPDVAAFQRFEFPRFSIRAVVERFGAPDRYLVTRRDHDFNFLIYDLPSGHSVAFYVSPPPRDQFAAAVIIDSRGEQVRLVK